MKFPRNQEECANSLQFYMEEYVENTPDAHELARKAYVSFIRSYSTYPSELKSTFYVKNLHLGHVAKSFGLREAPSEINSNGSDHRSVGGAHHFNKLTRDSKTRGGPDANGNRDINWRTSLPARKRSEQANNNGAGLVGLLRNYKSVSEFDSGLGGVAAGAGGHKTKKTKVSLAERMKRAAIVKTSNNPTSKPNKRENNKKIKIVKKNMDIFD